MASRRMRILAAAAGVLLLAVLGLLGLRFKPGNVPVQTVTVQEGRFEARLPEAGELQRARVVTLAALVDGNIGEVLVRSGDRVSEGALLLTLVNPELDSALEKARAAYSAAQGRALKASQTLPVQNKSAVLQARAALRQAEQDLVQGAQSGLGYGGITAREQMVAADADVSRTKTEYDQAKRVADSNDQLYQTGSVPRNTMEQTRGQAEEARVAYEQALEHRRILQQTLAQDQKYLQERVRASRDALQQAETNLSVTGSGDVAAAEADANTAKAELRLAELQVSRLSVRAPFSGIVESIASQSNDALRQLRPGDSVRVGQALVTLAGGEGFIARAKVDEQDASEIAIGQRAVVSSASFGSKTLAGRVQSIAAVAQHSDDASSVARQILTTIDLEQTLPFLRDGMSVDIDIVTAALDHVIAIPSGAIRRDREKSYVFIVSDGKAKRVDVVTGPASDTETVIKQGLKSGDVLIIEQNSALEAGTAVRPTSRPAPFASPT